MEYTASPDENKRVFLKTVFAAISEVVEECGVEQAKRMTLDEMVEWVANRPLD